MGCSYLLPRAAIWDWGGWGRQRRASLTFLAHTTNYNSHAHSNSLEGDGQTSPDSSSWLTSLQRQKGEMLFYWWRGQCKVHWMTSSSIIITMTYLLSRTTHVFWELTAEGIHIFEHFMLWRSELKSFVYYQTRWGKIFKYTNYGLSWSSKIYSLIIQVFIGPFCVVVVHKITSPPILKEIKSVLWV